MVMAQRYRGTILVHLRHRIGANADVEQSDAELLQRFAAARDDAAFALLMQRHGTMVLRLCRSRLRHEQDAEDAFQATFLVLARMAGSIRNGRSLGSWLYGVAHRIAMRACKAAARRRERECRASDTPAGDTTMAVALRELQGMLDDEIDRLPEKYRAPFVLCCLEGKSRDEAAQALGWNKGTLAGRLAHARLLLRQRLTRRGVTLTAALAALALVPLESQASVPALLAATTLRAALAFAVGGTATSGSAASVLAMGVLRGLLFGRLQRLAMLLAALMLIPAGAGLAALGAWTTSDDAPALPALPALAAQAAGPTEPAPPPPRMDDLGDPLPDGVVRRFGTVRLRQAGPMAFSPNGKTIATGGGPNRSDVVLWDRQTAKVLRRYKTDGGLLRLQFSPDGRCLAVWTGAVFTNPVFDVDADKALFRFKGENGTFSRDGRYLLAVRCDTDNPVVGRWEVDTGKLTAEWTLPAGLRGVVLSPDARTVAYLRDGAPVVYDLERKAEGRRLDGPQMHALTFGAGGRLLLAWGGMRGLRLWDVATGKQEFAVDRLVDAATVFDDGRRVAWTGYDERSITYPWVADIGKEPRRLGVPITNLGSHLAFSPDGGTLAVGTDAAAVELRDVITGKSVLALDGNTGRIFGLELSPDGVCLATYDTYRALVWERATGKLLRQLPENGSSPAPGQPPLVWDVRLNADGQLRRGQEQRPDSHWNTLNVPALDRLQKLQLRDDDAPLAFDGFQGTVLDVIESQNGQYLAVRLSDRRPDGSGGIGRNAGMTTRVWDCRTRQPLDHMRPPQSHLLGAFSPDNRLVVTTAPEGTIHLWDLASGKERLSMRGHTGANVRSVLFTPDQRFLFSGGDDAQVLQWDLTGRARDGMWRAAHHDAKQQQQLWTQLISDEPGVAHKAIWELAADPAATVAMLERRLKPLAGPPANEIAGLIAQLDSDEFATRQEGQARLVKLGDAVVPALRQTLTGTPPLEQRRRIEKLLEQLAPPALSGDALRADRAIEILERIATPDARLMLGVLAKGLPGARFTQAAAESLKRLEGH
jgi:RNA polymerase sigma factor (sigma-70 family)